MRVLMLVASSVTSDVRVLREAQTLAEVGHAVHIVGRDVPVGAGGGGAVTIATASPGTGLRPLRSASVTQSGSSASRPSRLESSRPGRMVRWLLLPEHRSLSFARWARQAEVVASAAAYDVVHAHDFTALGVGSRLAERRDVPLVYDAHELWSARHRIGRPTPLQNLRQRRTEQRLGERAAVVLTVGEALAGRFRDAYGWEHVTVVRNTFPMPTTPVRPAAGAPAAAVYAGRLAAGRDLETVARASRLTDLPFRLLGPADRFWSARFDPGGCTVLPAVDVPAVEEALRSAGLALVTLEEDAGNHQIALPNKLFQAVAARVPVVASDVGELATTVRAHGLGVLYRPGDAEALARAIEEARARYGELVAAVARAGEALSWTADGAALVAAYRGVGAR